MFVMGRLDQMLLVEHLKRKAASPAFSCFYTAAHAIIIPDTCTLCIFSRQSTAVVPFFPLQVMVAHTAFTEATDLLLKSHAWLVKDWLLQGMHCESIH